MMRLFNFSGRGGRRLAASLGLLLIAALVVPVAALASTGSGGRP